MRQTLRFLGAIALILLTALTGNSDSIDPAAIQDIAAIPTPLSEPIGQTFVARAPRLSAIQVLWSVPANYAPPPEARITLHLRDSPASERDLATASIPLHPIRNNEFSKFTFAPLPDSENQSYYIYLESDANAIALWSSGEDAYADGALYINHTSTPRDLSFRAYYTPDLGMLARALAQTLGRFPLPIFFFALFIFSFASSPALQRTQRGASVAFRPFAAFAPLLFLAWLAFAVALLQIRDVPAPLWVDSLTHAQYVQFILTNARLPLVSFYHLGYHVLAALAAKAFTLSVPQALLLTGQFSWVLVGVAVFFLSRKIFADQRLGLPHPRGTTGEPSPSPNIGALVAAACVWFLSPTPAYFITWGRYPLVLGSALLALALLGALKLIEQRDARGVFFAAITFAALAFTQIRLVAFYGSFVIIYLLVFRVKAQSPISTHPLPMTKRLILSLSFLLLPALWLAYLFSGGVTLQSILAQNQTAPSIDWPTTLDVLQTHHGAELFFLAALSAILGLVRRARVTFLILGWVAALAAIALTLRAPLFGELVPLSLVALMAFLPAAILVGDAARLAYEHWRAPHPVIHAAVWVALIGGVSLLGARDMVNLTNPATILFTRADERAMDWIDANTPRDARFLINSFNWVGSAFVPADGGGWIPFFTGNPVEYLDASASPGDSESVLAQWIQTRRINYIYLGSRAGTLSASEFLTHPESFSLVYAAGGVKIFQIR